MTNDIISLLHALGFRTSRESFVAFLEEATKAGHSAAQVVAGLAQLERRSRDAFNLERRTKYAKLGKFKPRAEFEWAHARSLDQELYEYLWTLDFIRKSQNVLFRGPAGVGKTTLAQNLGQEALRQGYRVKFLSLAQLLADLVRQESIPALERRLRAYARPDLLVLDELGYMPADARAADLLFNVLSRRHEERSTIITTNLSFKQWDTVFPSVSSVTVIVDRFSQHCHIVDIDADSWRQKHRLSARAR